MPAAIARYVHAPRYAWYVLAILFLVYVLNFVDRQIISILAEDIKRDLHLRDEELGFLYGTAFGVFYSLFGIPLGRLADSWPRTRLLTVGLVLWSTMTLASGFSINKGALSAARMGVGVGEATASPAAFSMLSDWFPPRLRATALAIYSSGLYVGAGISLFAGGWIVERWNAAYPNGGMAGIVGWQAAFFAVGVPGLLLAILTGTLREPQRGRSEGQQHASPGRAPTQFIGDLMAILPPLTLISAARAGQKALLANVGVLAVVAGAVALLVKLGEPAAQWGALGVGAYATFSWASALHRTDRPTFALIWGTPAFICAVVAYSLNALIAYASGFWAAPYAIRVLHFAPTQVGLYAGGSLAVSGFLGVTIGGMLSDRLRHHVAGGRLLLLIWGAVSPAPFIAVAYSSTSPLVFFPCVFAAQFAASMALGPTAATVQDLVLPRMRGTATAVFLLGTTLLGLALGPYLAGRLSSLTGSLSAGMLSLLATVPLGLAAALLAHRLVPTAETTRMARASAAGEPE